ncbi:MAG TPA: undecaprenyl-phosphate galactose phosphotransferase WbaP [Azospirillaceae bacterium]|nr:undecaprenyl-phosphate galactose phosphotransferase WbaP [Azospirillaceae bacterium]
MSTEVDVSAMRSHSSGSLFRNSTLLLLGDVAAAIGAFALSGMLAHTLSDALAAGPVPPMDSETIGRRFIHYGACVAGLMMWLTVQGHYNRRIPFWTETKQLLTALALVAVLDGFSQYAFKQQFSRVWLGTNWVLLAVMMFGMRHAVKAALMAVGAWQCPTLLVGSGATIGAARDALASERHLGYEVIGHVDIGSADAATAASLVRHAYRTRGAGFVVVAADAADLSRAEPIVNELVRRRIPFAIIPSIFGMSVLGLRSDYFFSHDVVLLTSRNNLSDPMTRAIKRAFDVSVASLLLLALAPFFLIAMAMIRRDGGPAFFAHKRVGMNGRMFGCMKFRTMVTNSDEVLRRVLESDPQARAEWEADFKLRNDPRITAIGRFLRRTSLDELPQLINVLKGEMSLVGPRPIVEAEIVRYGDDFRYYLETRPGLTGLWQVSGRNDASYAQRVKLDAWYVKNWSLWHDITILLKTVRVVLTAKGAY